MSDGIFEKLPCGCIIDSDRIIPCCYKDEDENSIHKKCMQLYFEESKTVAEIWNIIGHGDDLNDYLELDPDNFEEVK